MISCSSIFDAIVLGAGTKLFYYVINHLMCLCVIYTPYMLFFLTTPDNVPAFDYNN